MINMKKMNNKQAGFTLIELVMVIVILGILSAFALPRFADLGGDAREAVFGGANGAARSAVAIVHAQALAEGKTAATGESVVLEGQTINLAYGYPTAANLDEAAGFDGITYAVTTGPDVGTITVGTCVSTYTQATSSTTGAPVVVTTLPTADGC
ncbi:type II secretion system protein [Alkalimarinus alittae]|uniref:type II secretion system protein n=1 Tax=Alkalimarinus alittae TaxID=2961619 RepID=UPI0029FF3E0B|nr:type II secretion system protein [Alkalimarinus alittae]